MHPESQESSIVISNPTKVADFFDNNRNWMQKNEILLLERSFDSAYKTEVQVYFPFRSADLGCFPSQNGNLLELNDTSYERSSLADHESNIEKIKDIFRYGFWLKNRSLFRFFGQEESSVSEAL